MKYFIDTEYRITLFDKYGHYDQEINLEQEQIDDLLEGFENYKKSKE